MAPAGVTVLSIAPPVARGDMPPVPRRLAGPGLPAHQQQCTNQQGASTHHAYKRVCADASQYLHRHAARVSGDELSCQHRWVHVVACRRPPVLRAVGVPLRPMKLGLGRPPAAPGVAALDTAVTFSSPSGNTCTRSIDSCRAPQGTRVSEGVCVGQMRRLKLDTDAGVLTACPVKTLVCGCCHLVLSAAATLHRAAAHPPCQSHTAGWGPWPWSPPQSGPASWPAQAH